MHHVLYKYKLILASVRGHFHIEFSQISKFYVVELFKSHYLNFFGSIALSLYELNNSLLLKLNSHHLNLFRSIALSLYKLNTMHLVSIIIY